MKVSQRPTKPKQQKIEVFQKKKDDENDDPSCWKEYFGGQPMLPEGQQLVTTLNTLKGDAIRNIYANWVRDQSGFPEIHVRHQIATGNIKDLHPLQPLSTQYLEFFHKDINMEPYLGTIHLPKDIPFDPKDKHRRPLFDYRFYLAKMQMMTTPVQNKIKTKPKKTQAPVAPKESLKPKKELEVTTQQLADATIKAFMRKDLIDQGKVEADECIFNSIISDSTCTEGFISSILTIPQIERLSNFQDQEFLVRDDIISLAEITGRLTLRENNSVHTKQNSSVRNTQPEPEKTKPKPKAKKQQEPVVRKETPTPTPTPVTPPPAPIPHSPPKLAPKKKPLKQEKTESPKVIEHNMPPHNKQKEPAKKTSLSPKKPIGKKTRKASVKDIVQKPNPNEYLSKHNIKIVPNIEVIAKVLLVFNDFSDSPSNEKKLSVLHENATLENIMSLYINASDSENMLYACCLFFRPMLPSENEKTFVGQIEMDSNIAYLAYLPTTDILTVNIQESTWMFKINWEFVNSFFVALCNGSTSGVFEELNGMLSTIFETAKQQNRDPGVWLKDPKTQKALRDFILMTFKYIETDSS